MRSQRSSSTTQQPRAPHSTHKARVAIGAILRVTSLFERSAVVWWRRRSGKFIVRPWRARCWPTPPVHSMQLTRSPMWFYATILLVLVLCAETWMRAGVSEPAVSTEGFSEATLREVSTHSPSPSIPVVRDEVQDTHNDVECDKQRAREERGLRIRTLQLRQSSLLLQPSPFQTEARRDSDGCLVPSERRVLLTITTGRSGTGYLASLLGGSPDVRAYHEAEPTMSGVDLRQLKYNGYEKTYKTRYNKKMEDAVLVEVKSMCNESVYADTSHLFAKSWWDVAMDALAREGIEVEVIVLRRAPIDVVGSLMRLDWPYQHEAWYYLPGQDRALAILPELPEWESLVKCDAILQIVEYVLDVELHVSQFRQRFPHVRMHEYTLEHLQQSVETAYSMYIELRVRPPVDELLSLLHGQAVNSRESTEAVLTPYHGTSYQRCSIYSKISVLVGLYARVARFPIAHPLLASLSDDLAACRAAYLREGWQDPVSGAWVLEYPVARVPRCKRRDVDNET